MKLKITALAILGLTSLTLPGFATSFGGTITQTVTESNDPLYAIGDTFIGYYRYDSATIDGDFFPNIPMITPPGVNNSLTGKIFFAFDGRPAAFGQPAEHPGTGLQSLTNGVNGGELVVSGGAIASFAWSFENGGYYTAFTTSTFIALSYYDRPIFDPGTGLFLPTPEVKGTLTISAPHEVPDATTTGWMLFASIGGLTLLTDRRKCRRQNCPNHS